MEEISAANESLKKEVGWTDKDAADAERRVLAMNGIASAITFARTEGSDLPLSTIGVIICEALADNHEARAIIRSMEEYLA